MTLPRKKNRYFYGFFLASAISSLNDPAIIHAQAAETVTLSMGGNDTTSPAHGISIPSRPPVTPSQLNPAQTVMLVQALQTIKDSTQKIASDHRDLHSSVSKVNYELVFYKYLDLFNLLVQILRDYYLHYHFLFPKGRKSRG